MFPPNYNRPSGTAFAGVANRLSATSARISGKTTVRRRPTGCSPMIGPRPSRRDPSAEEPTPGAVGNVKFVGGDDKTFYIMSGKDRCRTQVNMTYFISTKHNDILVRASFSPPRGRRPERPDEGRRVYGWGRRNGAANLEARRLATALSDPRGESVHPQKPARQPPGGGK